MLIVMMRSVGTDNKSGKVMQAWLQLGDDRWVPNAGRRLLVVGYEYRKRMER